MKPNKILRILLIPGGGKKWSIERSRLACDLGLHKKVDIILFTGGGRIILSSGESISEAEYMYNHLSEPLPYCKVLKERSSRDTFENISLSLQILSKMTINFDEASVTVASDADHLRRFRISWGPIARTAWTSRIPLKVEFKELCGWRSFKDHVIEMAFYVLHKLSPTGTTWPTSWLVARNRARRS